MDSQARRQLVCDILDTKDRHGWRPLLLVQWQPPLTQTWYGEAIEVAGCPSGYVLLSEPSVAQVESYGALRRIDPACTTEIVNRHLLVDRIGLQEDRAGLYYSLANTLTHWAEVDPLKLNPMVAEERATSGPLSQFILSHLFAVNPQYPAKDLTSTTYSELLAQLFATERTLHVATGGQARPFELVTPEMERDRQVTEERKRLANIMEQAEEPREPLPPPPTMADLTNLATERSRKKLKQVQPDQMGRKREFR
jgi:hypothetical protein